MHRSAVPDKHQRHKAARQDGARVVHQELDETSRHPEHQGTGHDERGEYGSASNAASPDRVPPKH